MRQDQRQRYNWSELGAVPNKPGIYAWYYAPEITEYDLRTTIAEIEQLRSTNPGDARSFIADFLDKAVFRYFQEEPFLVDLKGPLKPSYRGVVEHHPTPSTSLVDRLADNPNRLHTIKQILEDSAPDFASPIYIGMSEHLQQRIAQHRRLIERYRNKTTGRGNGSTGFNSDRDHSFAREVSKRGLSPGRLFVVIRLIDKDNQYVDLENILNRIHYPLLGRN